MLGFVPFCEPGLGPDPGGGGAALRDTNGLARGGFLRIGRRGFAFGRGGRCFAFSDGGALILTIALREDWIVGRTASEAEAAATPLEGRVIRTQQSARGDRYAQARRFEGDC